MGVAITWMNKSTGSKHILDKHMNQNKQSRATTATLEDCTAAVKSPEATHFDQLGLECQNASDKNMITLKPVLSHHTTVGTQDGTRGGKITV